MEALEQRNMGNGCFRSGEPVYILPTLKETRGYCNETKN